MNQHFGLLLKKKLLSLRFTEENRFEGCTAEEIDAIKTAQGVKCLPQKYIEFLEVMGKDAGGRFLVGDDYDYSHLLELKSIAQEIINELAEVSPEIAFKIPTDAFVFYMHHGVYFFYFLTAGCDDDPPVHMWSEVRGNKQVNDHISEQFINAVQELAAFDYRPHTQSNRIANSRKSWFRRLIDEITKTIRSI